MAVSDYIRQYWVSFGLRVQQWQCLTPPKTGALVLQSKCIFSTLARSQQMANAFKETTYVRLDRWKRRNQWKPAPSSRQNLPTSVTDILSVWQTIKTTNLKWSERSWNIIDFSLKQNKRVGKQQLSNNLLVSRDMFIVNSSHSRYSKSSWLIIFQRFNFKTK